MLKWCKTLMSLILFLAHAHYRKQGWATPMLTLLLCISVTWTVLPPTGHFMFSFSLHVSGNVGSFWKPTLSAVLPVCPADPVFVSHSTPRDSHLSEAAVTRACLSLCGVIGLPPTILSAVISRRVSAFLFTFSCCWTKQLQGDKTRSSIMLAVCLPGSLSTCASVSDAPVCFS